MTFRQKLAHVIGGKEYADAVAREVTRQQQKAARATADYYVATCKDPRP